MAPYQPWLSNPGWGNAATVAKKKKPAAVKPALPPVFQPPAIAWTPPNQQGVRQQQSNPYAGLLDSYMSQQRADFGAQSLADKAGRDAAIKRFLVSYGEVPDFASLGVSDAAKGVLGGITGIKDLADKNTAEGTSIKARLDAANATAQRKIPANLAGRGLLRSGQTGFDLNEQGQQAKNAKFDVLNEMLGNIEGTVSNFAQAEAQRARALADAELQASMQAMGDYGGDIGYDDDYSFDPFTNQQNPNILSGWAQAAQAQNAAMAKYKPPAKKKAAPKRVVKTQVGRGPARPF